MFKINIFTFFSQTHKSFMQAWQTRTLKGNKAPPRYCLPRRPPTNRTDNASRAQTAPTPKRLPTQAIRRLQSAKREKSTKQWTPRTPNDGWGKNLPRSLSVFSKG